MSTATVNGRQPGRSSAWWCGSLACAIAWYLASGNRAHLVSAYKDYRRTASADVAAHLDAIWKGDKKR